jgi:membrane-bound lytic murein transglycosylase D
MVAPEPAESAVLAPEPAEPVPLVARDVVYEEMSEPLVVGVIEIETQPMVTAAIVLNESIIEEIDVGVTPIGEEAPIGDVLLADPSDYVVADDGTIEVQAAETLGHYADWLEIRTQQLRDLNGYSFRQPLVIGHRLRLSFSEVNRETFMARRIAHHREIQEAFFVRYRITETTAHNLRRGESVWDLTRQRYKVPVWLLRQYNPDLDIGRVKPGMQVVFPQIERIEMDSSPRSSLAEAS